MRPPAYHYILGPRYKFNPEHYKFIQLTWLTPNRPLWSFYSVLNRNALSMKIYFRLLISILFDKLKPTFCSILSSSQYSKHYVGWCRKISAYSYLKRLTNQRNPLDSKSHRVLVALLRAAFVSLTSLSLARLSESWTLAICASLNCSAQTTPLFVIK